MKKLIKPEKKKELQKLTVIENLKTPKMVRQHLTENPEDWGLIMESLEERINETYQKKQGKEDLIEAMTVVCYEFKNIKGGKTNLRNITYEINHGLISSFLHNYIIENRNFPAIATIGHETGLSRNTVYKHLNDGLKTKYNKLVTGKLEYMTSSALTALYHIGINDRNATALKHFINLARKTATPTSTINNYIQINNLKLSKDEFEQLPENVILEVEQIISKSLKK